MVDDEPQMSAEQRRYVLEEENGRTSESDMSESSVKQVDRTPKAVGGDETIKDGKENARETPVNEITKRSKASPRGIGGGMDARSDRLNRMNEVDSTTAPAVDVAGTQEDIRLGMRQRTNGGEECIAAGEGSNDRPESQVT